MRKITNGWNKSWHRLLVLFLFTTFSLVGWGQAILTETFNYATPAYIGGNGNAGSSSNSWTTHSVTSGQTTTIDISDGSLTYTGLASSTGNKVYLFSNANATSRDINKAFTTSATTIYYSTLINVVDATQISAASPDYFMSLGATSGSSVTTLPARLGIKSVNTAANYRLSILNTSTGTLVYTEFAQDLNFGTTYLIVVKYDRTTTPTTANLWVNPSTLGSTDPSGSVTNTSGTGTVTAFGSICLRNSATSPKVEIDEIRVGTTFASVTPIPDVIPPVWTSTYPKSANVAATTADVLVNTDEPGKAYYVVLANGATAPSSAQVKAGTDASDAAAFKSGFITVAAGTTEYSATISGLSDKTDYDIYVVAEDDEGTPNVQASPEKIDVTTLGIAPALTADATANNVENNLEITFSDDATWRAAITAVKDGSNTLTVTTDYTVAGGVITLIPSASNTLKASGSRTITVLATGYADATVTQDILAGAINTTNSTVTVSAPLALSTTSTITITAKDQYNNLIEGYTAKFEATITDNDATTDESYKINAVDYTATASDIDLSTTNTSGVSTFDVLMPALVDADDAISVQVQLNDGTTNLGTAYSYVAPSAPALSATATLTEINLNGATIALTVLNETFADGTLDKANFTLNNAPSNTTVESVAYNTASSATVTLAYDDTDFDADVTTLTVTVAGVELTLASPLTSNNLAVTATVETTPIVTTDAAITTNGETTATWGGSITADGGELVTEKGICWSLLANPTTADNKVVDAAVGTTITGNLTGLTTFTQYYVKAYATNLLGTSYGDEQTFTTLKSSAKAITATTIGTLDEGNKMILNVPGSKTVTELKAAITVSPLATFEVYTVAGGTTVATGTSFVNSLYVVKVTAQDLTTQEYSLTIEVISVDNLLDLISLPANTRALYTGKATVTYTRTSRNQKYIQDATGAVLIDDNTTAPGFINGTYAIGEGITNIEGKIVLYNGLIEFTPTTLTGETCTGNPVITPETRTMESLTHADQCKLVKVVGFSFDPAGAQYLLNSAFVSSKNYDIVGIPLATFAYRTAFSEADYIAAGIPTTPITAVALVGQFNTQMQITARNLADIQSAVATVSSTVYTVGSSDITNVPYFTSLVDFKTNLTAAAGANFNVFDADGTTSATVLDDTKLVVVTAEDGITKHTYSIMRNVAQTGKEITAFAIGTDVGVITGTDITIEVPNSTDVTNLVATFTLSAGATAKIGTDLQESGVTANNFTNPVIYTVMAEDGTAKDWTVTVTKSTVLLTGKDFLTYSIDGVDATINGDYTITATLPYGVSLNSLVATFTLSQAASAKVGATPQESGVTVNDFTASVTYTVTAEDASTQDWVVTITNELPSTDASVSSLVYNVDGSAGTITDVPFGTPLATFKSNITPAAKATFEVYESNGTTLATDLATGYKVIGTAQDASTTKVYTITINEAPVADLFFSEYIEGSSNNKALEIFNPTDAAIDLSGYVIKASNNGLGFGITTTGADTRYVLPLSGTIAPGDVYVIYNTAATASGIIDAGDLGLTFSSTVNDPVNLGANVASFNGNDALGLFKNDVLIDVFGGEFITANFDVAGITAAAQNHTLVRKSSVKVGNADWTLVAGTDAITSEWMVNDIDIFTNLGSHTMDAEADTEAPVATYTPIEGATGVFITVNPTISFNEAVYKAADGSSFTANEDVTSLIEFYETATPANTVNFTATINGILVSIVPSANLKNSVQYSVALKAAVVEDKAGNENLLSQVSFTTIDASLPFIELTAPVGGETFYAGTNTLITWNSENIDSVKVEVYIPSSSVWSQVSSTIADDGAETISIPADADYGTTYKIRVSDATNPAVVDSSEVFTIIALATDIADLRSNKVGDKVKLIGKSVVTFVQSNRNQKFIQDATGAILIDDLSKIITSTYAIGDEMPGLEGQLTEFGGMLEFVPSMNPGAPTASGLSVTPQVITFTEFAANFEMYESELITFENARFTSADGTVAFATGTSYPLSDGINTANFYTNFYDANYIGNVIPVTKGVITGIANSRSTGNYITSRNASEMVFPSNVATLQDLKVDGTTIAGFNSNVFAYNMELPFGTTAVPVLSGTATDANATVTVIQATTLPTQDTVRVTAQDGETIVDYIVNFTLGAEPSYTVTFTVTDESSAIVDFAKVEFNGTSQVTDDRGNAVFTNVFAVTDAPFTVTKGVDLYEIYNGTVTVTNADVMVDVVLKTVGINDQSNLVSSMYPNPTNGQVFLTLNSDVQAAQITVTDITGKVILTKEWSALESFIDLNGNKQGIYFIEVTSGNKTFIGRIMLN